MSDNIRPAGMRIIVIDDDAMVLHALGTVLQEFGFSVTAFEDPRKALEWISSNGADIVVSDICMPECDGFQVLKSIKEIDPRCDVIFITAHGQIDIAIKALREGATDFFEKPLTTAALRAAIERTSRFRALAQQQTLLANQVTALSSEISFHLNAKGIMLGRSESMKQLAADIVDIAKSAATVLIAGESGTGKELVANAIHLSSPRRGKPFLIMNCPSIPEDLFESEMFGHRRGAFTGAIETRSGYVEAAEGGTLFLDEIGDLPIKSQSKILRLLEQKTYLPVGERQERLADVRIVAATNQSLESMVKEKTFREDLFYRLNVCVLRIPPLRNRREDIPVLALFFALRFAAEMGKSIDGIEEDALALLASHDFPGNVRELRNILERAVILCKHKGLLKVSDLPPLSSDSTQLQQDKWPSSAIRFEEVEQQLYVEALRRTENNVSAAARLLGLSRGKLRRRLGVFNINAD